MVADDGVIDYNEIEHKFKSPSELVILDKDGKLVGFKGARYKVVTQDSYLNMPAELADAHNSCVDSLLEIMENVLSGTCYKNVDSFMEDITQVIKPYNSVCEEMRSFIADQQIRRNTEEIQLKERYGLDEQIDELDEAEELARLSSRYKLDSDVAPYESHLPKSLRGDQSLKGNHDVMYLFSLSPIVEPDRRIPQLLKTIGELADKQFKLN